MWLAYFFVPPENRILLVYEATKFKPLKTSEIISKFLASNFPIFLDYNFLWTLVLSNQFQVFFFCSRSNILSPRRLNQNFNFRAIRQLLHKFHKFVRLHFLWTLFLSNQFRMFSFSAAIVQYWNAGSYAKVLILKSSGNSCKNKPNILDTHFIGTSILI